MADTKISGLSTATALGSTEEIALIQGSSTVKDSLANIQAMVLGSTGNAGTLVSYSSLAAVASVAAGIANTALVSTSSLIAPSFATVPTAAIADDAITLAKMSTGTAGNLISYSSLGDPVAVGTGTAAQVLTSNGAGLAPTFQALAASGALTLVGSNTTEATTTSTSVVDIMTVTGLSITTATPFLVIYSYRKTTGAAAGMGLGLKINTTTTATAGVDTSRLARAQPANETLDGMGVIIVAPRTANNLNGVVAFSHGRDSSGLGEFTQPTINAAFPNATITDIIITGISGSASVTVAVSSMHVYTFGV